MSVSIKSTREIELMREAGRLLEITHNEMEKALKPGMSTMDINRIGEEVIRSFGCIPSFLNYNGYPASICVSVNDEVVHGIPHKDHIIQEGDIVSLDAGPDLQGIPFRRGPYPFGGRMQPRGEETRRSDEAELFRGHQVCEGRTSSFRDLRSHRRLCGKLRLRCCPRPGGARHRHPSA